MIIGIGNDIVDMRRLARVVAQFPQKFPQRILTPHEAGEMPPPPAHLQFLAARWAAKEALGKALGTGVRAPLTLRQVGVAHAVSGQPGFVFAAVAADFLRGKGVQHCHLSISHDGNYTSAVVVAEGAGK